MEWYAAYAIIGSLCFVVVIVDLLFLVVHPGEKGIMIKEIDRKIKEKEILLTLSVINEETTKNNSISIIDKT